MNGKNEKIEPKKTYQPLTDSQVSNWRRILQQPPFNLGFWATIMPVSEIQIIRDHMQELADNPPPELSKLKTA